MRSRNERKEAEFITVTLFLTSGLCILGHVASTNFHDSLSLLFFTVHRSWPVFQTTTCVDTEIMQINSCWWTNAGGPQENVSYESYLLDQPGCLTWRVLKMGGKWPYSCCFIGYSFQYLFKIACSIVLLYPTSIFLCFLSAFIWFSHRLILTEPLLGRNPVLFHRINQTSRPSISYQ